MNRSSEERHYHFTDLRPIQAFPALRRLSCIGSGYVKGHLTDLTPLAGLPLEQLSVRNNPQLSDLRPLRNTALAELDAVGCGIATLADLNGSQLKKHAISNTPVRDLSPIANMPLLEELSCTHCPFDSLEPLAKSGIHTLNFSYNPGRDEKVLRQMKKLQSINGVPVQDFWRVQRAM